MENKQGRWVRSRYNTLAEVEAMVSGSAGSLEVLGGIRAGDGSVAGYRVRSRDANAVTGRVTWDYELRTGGVYVRASVETGHQIA